MKHHRSVLWGALVVLLAVTVAAPASAAELADCAAYGRLDFFPAGRLNRPDAWSRANQVKAGNDDRYSLFPIALYGHPMPKLHFLPVHPLMLPGGRPVPEACRPAASWRRRALGNVEWGTVIKPAAFTWTATLDGRQAGGSFQTVLSNLTEIPHWTQNVWNLRDGKHELAITAFITAGSALIEDGPHGRKVPEKDIAITQTVTFYKLTQRPTLKLRVSTCAEDFQLQATDMWPQPVPAPGGLGALFKPVYHIWGRFDSGIDGSTYSGDDGSAGAALHYFDQYWIRQLGSPNAISVNLPGIQQGWYELHVEGSLTTDMPSLLSLSGGGTFNMNDTDPKWMYIQPGGTLQATGVSLRGQPKFSGALVEGLNGSRMGVQSTNTTLVSFDGPQQSMEVGEYASFTWQYLGLGNTTCTIDGRPVFTDPHTGQCAPPLKRKITDNLRHTLVVTFTDVCGVTRRDAMNFSVAEGWSTNATSDGLPMEDASAAPMMPPPLPNMRLSGPRAGARVAADGEGRAPAQGAVRSAAGGAAPRAGAAAAAAAAGLAAAALALLL